MILEVASTCHGDIRPHNILLDFCRKSKGEEIHDLMLINHKSSYAFEQFRSEDFKTCELSYQAPEVIERIIDKETANRMKS
jgi:hypothetical protein